MEGLQGVLNGLGVHMVSSIGEVQAFHRRFEVVRREVRVDHRHRDV